MICFLATVAKKLMCSRTSKLSFEDTYQHKTNDYVLLPGNGLNYSASQKMLHF